MGDVSTIGLDIAKSVFQAHGADASGAVHQRTQLMNTLRGHLAEYGHVAPKGVMYGGRLIAEIEDPSLGLPPIRRRLLTRSNS